MKVVVVESPAKAKTINKYLGSDFTVLASYGHIRDLPAKDGSVDPENGFAMQWETDPKSLTHVKKIRQALKDANELYLATDPDREGEAISWHVQNVLDEGKALKGKTVKRIVFNEITKTAVRDALRHPRDINQELVDAYLARRALDYLVGFTLSPVLWRKLPGARSAGRVQSVALRLVCEREAEIEKFVSQEYWTVAADFLTPRSEMITAQLTHLNGKKLGKFDLSGDTATAAAQLIASSAFHVESVERKTVKRNPYPPFTTSTLQQEASRKLHFSARQTMQLAQRLYEGVDIGGETVGLITYMRTDSVHMAAEAVAACRELIATDYGDAYLPKTPRHFKTKTKNAQEAHEAIRPTQLTLRPSQVASYLARDQLRLYELIWKRTVASHMESAILDQVAVDIASEDRKTVLRATGSVIKFDGFFTLYREDRDDSDDSADDTDRRLPVTNENDPMHHKATRPEQHFTQPPLRFSEASLVKRMEELGIGRPSTYASILSVLQDRTYVRLENRRFIPEDRGRLVTAFLENFFNRYVQYTFTADMEDKLDEISNGEIPWKNVLSDFWKAFHPSVDETRELRIVDVLEALDKALGPHFFPDREDDHDPRLCPSCREGRLSLKLGKFGAFIGCSNYPECRYTRPLAVNGENGDAPDEFTEGPKTLGTDPESSKPVTLRKGPYGHYVQLGDSEGKEKPKRVSLPKGMQPAGIELKEALALLDLPRTVGTHPESGKVISAGIGRFGPYLRHDGAYKSIPAGDDVLSIGLNRAVDLLASTNAHAKAAAGTPLGEHPDGGTVTLNSQGRYGPYVSHGGIHATLPKDHDPSSMTLEKAVELLQAKVAKGGGKKKASARKTTGVKAKGTSKTTAKTTPKKATVKKKPGKKADSAKATARKSTTAS